MARAVGAEASVQEVGGLGGAPRSPDGRGWVRGGERALASLPKRAHRFLVLHWAFPWECTAFRCVTREHVCTVAGDGAPRRTQAAEPPEGWCPSPGAAGLG